MTQYQIAKWIVEHKTCHGVSCHGYRTDVNPGLACPLSDGEFNCDNYESPVQAAQAWLDEHKEDV